MVYNYFKLPVQYISCNIVKIFISILSLFDTSGSCALPMVLREKSIGGGGSNRNGFG